MSKTTKEKEMSVPIGGEWLPESRAYVKSLEDRIKALEDILADPKKPVTIGPRSKE